MNDITESNTNNTINTVKINTTKRLGYLDCAKGILIVLVIIGHMYWILGDAHNPYIDMLFKVDIVKTFTPFYMACFFIITGFCSGFNKPFMSFLWNNIKTLLLPVFFVNVLINLLSLNFESVYLWGANWFLNTLLYCKLLYYLILKIRSSLYRHLIILLIYFGGCMMSNYLHIDRESSYLYVLHTMIFLAYLHIGYHLKEYKNLLDYPFCWTIAYVCLWGLSYCLFDNQVPGCWTIIHLWPYSYTISLLLSFCGSMSLLSICKILPSSKHIEFIGKNSLIIYLLHMVVLSKIIIFLYKFCSSTIMAIVLFFTSLFLIMYVCYLISIVINTKYLKWIVGKF